MENTTHETTRNEVIIEVPNQISIDISIVKDQKRITLKSNGGEETINMFLMVFRRICRRIENSEEIENLILRYNNSEQSQNTYLTLTEEDLNKILYAILFL